MKKREKIFATSLIALSVLTLAACGNNGGTNAEGEGAASGTNEDGYSVAFLTNTQNNTFQMAMHEKYQQMAEENGVEYTMFDPDYDLNRQINQLSDAANQGFDAVFVIPVDSAGIRQGLEELNEKGITVINVDTAVIEEDRDLVDSIVATDAFMAGKLAGEQMVKDYPDGAKIAILDFPANESCVQRVAGFMEGLGENASKFEIVAQQDGKAALDVSLPLAEDIIQANPDINAFFAINDPSALGVAAAIEASGRDDIGVYSVDASPDGKAALVEGSFTAVAAQVPIQIAETSFNMALEVLNGGEVEKEVYLPSFLVTKEQAEETAGQWQ